jgi:peptide chain release factor 2
MSHSGFWQDQQNANRLVQELKSLKAIVEPWQKHREKYQELKEFIQISDQDSSFLNQIKQEIEEFKKELVDLELKSILNNEFDKNNAILSINAGAGGTESCDWVSMLLRMYTRWAERKGYKLEMTDLLPAEEAGVKNVTLRVLGDYAFGYLKAERGVHRLVRISPFDANKRRHTSFASVDVIPEITEDIKLQIKEEDLKIDTYRSSGPGGQHVNVTDSAVRITHLPTGIVVQCQNERSQYQNKQTAIKILKARLYELERIKQDEKLSSLHGAKRKIEWGSQIRSYIMHPYSLVKDHRTNVETSNVQAVMDGDIEIFIAAFLKKPPSSSK